MSLCLCRDVDMSLVWTRLNIPDHILTPRSEYHKLWIRFCVFFHPSHKTWQICIKQRNFITLQISLGKCWQVGGGGGGERGRGAVGDFRWTKEVDMGARRGYGTHIRDTSTLIKTRPDAKQDQNKSSNLVFLRFASVTSFPILGKYGYTFSNALHQKMFSST